MNKEISERFEDIAIAVVLAIGIVLVIMHWR